MRWAIDLSKVNAVPNPNFKLASLSLLSVSLIFGQSSSAQSQWETDYASQAQSRSRPQGIRPSRFHETLKLQQSTLKEQSEPFFVLSHRQVKHYDLNLQHTLLSDLDPASKDEGSKSLYAHLSCDAPFSLQIGVGIRKKIHQDIKVINFEWVDQKNHSPSYFFKPSKDLSRCRLSAVGNINNQKIKARVNLIEESIAYPNHKFLQNQIETCLVPYSNDSQKELFLTDSMQHMSCPVPATKFEGFPETYDGLRGKLETLIGYKITDADIDDHDSNMPLDFSRMPRYDAILVSYLVIRNDFYGQMLARALREHANRGTMVRILISDTPTLKSDRPFLNELAHSSGHIKLQSYRWPNHRSSGDGTWVAYFHRTMHMKFLVTLSEKSPDLNKVLIGGRNIHEGFVYQKNPLKKRFASTQPDPKWPFWRDYEVRITSKELAHQIVQHFFMFWYRDTRSIRMQSVNRTVKTRSEEHTYLDSVKTPLVRHVVSVPFKDDGALEDFYTQMIDSAQKSIVITTPYFRISKKLFNAFIRARARSVDVILVTRLDLSTDDTASFIISDVNKQSVNRLFKEVEIHEYMVPAEILHSKLVIIDDNISFVSSVNLNKRSFIHDIENGALIWSREYNQELRQLVDKYIDESRIVEKSNRILLWKKALIQAFDDKF